ncbi:MAG: sensor histidine kinase [Bacteroidales bacterium]|nr:sensor histidine kinase [Bacteroidales bacterium]
MIKIFPALILAIFIQKYSCSQNPVADSLEKAIRSGAAKDTNLVNALNRLSINYWYKDTEKAYTLTRRALKEAERIDFSRGRAVSNNLLGVVFDIKSEFDSALYYYQQSVKFSKETGYLKILASAYNNIGMVHKNRGNFSPAIKAYYDALRIFEKQKDQKGIGNAYNNLGLVYSDMKQNQLALDLHMKSLKIREKTGDKYGIGASLTNLGLVYSQLNDQEKAMECYLKSLRIKEELGDKYGLGILLNNLALIYMDKKEYRKAIDMYRRSAIYHREVEDHNGLIFTFINTGAAYTRTGDYKKAELEIDSAKQIALEIKSLLRLAKVYSAYASLYYSSGKYYKASQAYRMLDSLKDSIYSENMSRNTAEMRELYDTEKKEGEIKLLQKENLIKNLEIAQQRNRFRNQLMVGAIFLMLVFSGVILWYIRSKYRLKVQAEQEKRQLQKEGYAAVVNAEEGERKRIAMELHDGLGQLLSAARLNVSVLEDVAQEQDKEAIGNAESLIDQAITDLRNISHNLMPSALIRLGLVAALNDMSAKINSGRHVKVEVQISGIDGRLPEDFEIALYRVVQEAVNNILRHANATIINISLSKIDETLNLEISDNGKGMPENAEKYSKGIGWNDIRSRVSLFNGNMILYSDPGAGTRININFSKPNL